MKQHLDTMFRSGFNSDGTPWRMYGMNLSAIRVGELN